MPFPVKAKCLEGANEIQRALQTGGYRLGCVRSAFFPVFKSSPVSCTDQIRERKMSMTCGTISSTPRNETLTLTSCQHVLSLNNIPFSPYFLIVSLQSLNFYWACFQFKNCRESIIEMGNSCHGVANCSGGKLFSEFSEHSEHTHKYHAYMHSIANIISSSY